MMHMKASESLSGIAVAGAFLRLIDIACQQASETSWGKQQKRSPLKTERSKECWPCRGKPGCWSKQLLPA